MRVGASPGTDLPSPLPEKSSCHFMAYNEKLLFEKGDFASGDLSSLLTHPTTHWIHLTGAVDPLFLQTLGTTFKLHPLVLEDIACRSERPKLDLYPDYLFIIVNLLSIDPKTFAITSEQVSLVLGKNFVLSFISKDGNFINPIKERLRHGNNRIRQKEADYLAYAILDLVADHTFTVLNQLDLQIETLEQELTRTTKPLILQRIQKNKRDLLTIRRAVWPMREVISQFRRLDTPLIQSETQIFMHDVYDHTIQAIDTIESFREMLSNLLEIYLSSISQRLNEIMKVLTIVATLFAPLTFITGFYGMNFDNIPGLHSEAAFLFTLFLMLAISSGMLYFFRRKKWI